MKIIAIALLILSLYSCANSSSKPSYQDSILWESPDLTEAKLLSDTIFAYVEQAANRTLSDKQLNAKAGPLKEKLDSIVAILRPDDAKELETYRGMLLNQMIDRKEKSKAH